MIWPAGRVPGRISWGPPLVATVIRSMSGAQPLGLLIVTVLLPDARFSVNEAEPTVSQFAVAGRFTVCPLITALRASAEV